jgi:uncharacterized membrane protein (DUF2068 family)
LAASEGLRPDGAAAPPQVLGRSLPVAVIAAEKALSAVGIWAIAAFALFLHHRVHHNPLSLLVWRDMLQDQEVSGRWAIVRWAVSLLPPLGPRLFLAIGILLTVWGALLGAEAVGFWFQFGWGELLIIVETASLIPVEIWRMVRHPHPTSVIALAINLAILWYVVTLYGRRFLAENAGRPFLQAVFGSYPQRAAGDGRPGGRESGGA